ncbi:MAG: glutamate synthase [Candidatus Bipolaricaulota bacterium]|nr:glutamate synthase [Candidatus Bipolaricaulota bacterium]
MIEKLIASRRSLEHNIVGHHAEAEGGCGVLGMIASEPIAGKHVYRSSIQMHNRGNGKGGGLAAVGLLPEQMRVSKEKLEDDYLIQIAYLDPAARKDVEENFLLPYFDVHQGYDVPSIKDYRAIPGLEIQPPLVWRYFARVKEAVLAEFIEKNELKGLDPRRAEDEFVYQNSYRLNKAFYASLGEKRAFVLCHGRNLLVFKIVGYAEQALQYYQLENLQAHGWIAHQRYPTKGRVWHPGGAHPFIGLHEALVHNGDFANYHGVCEYLKQRNISPLFLTDTEVSVLLFDLWSRVYGYPLEYVIEALAPTTERDFLMLPTEKQELYKQIQVAHLHGSPDGPWFFIIIRNEPYEKRWQLIGITDTSMLRPQVFALHDGPVQIGLIASEKQAIDAALQSLHEEDPRICPVADKYWNARGGSHTDGGAFVFTVDYSQPALKLVCTDKFGKRVSSGPHPRPLSRSDLRESGGRQAGVRAFLPINPITTVLDPAQPALEAFAELTGEIATWDYDLLEEFLSVCVEDSRRGDAQRRHALELLTLLVDRRYRVEKMERKWLRALVEQAINALLDAVPLGGAPSRSEFVRITWRTRTTLAAPEAPTQTLVIDATGFAPEGDDALSLFIVRAYKLGWRKFVLYRCCGQRFIGSGLGPRSHGVRLDVYGSSGDYLASGLDGAEIYVHNNGQDQLGQIFHDGKLVVYGDVGQTFFYGAKGGTAYIFGNAAGRPLINAVGCPRVVINGTALDYLAESFMAGDPLNGGGFVVLNGIALDEAGKMRELETPYPGSNLFSLASGGAIYVRDPHRKLDEDQLNGGCYAELTDADWALIAPYLKENERLFGITVEDLLTVGGERLPPERVYRKVRPVKTSVLS